MWTYDPPDPCGSAVFYDKYTKITQENILYFMNKSPAVKLLECMTELKSCDKYCTWIYSGSWGHLEPCNIFNITPQSEFQRIIRQYQTINEHFKKVKERWEKHPSTIWLVMVFHNLSTRGHSSMSGFETPQTQQPADPRRAAQNTSK